MFAAILRTSSLVTSLAARAYAGCRPGAAYTAKPPAPVKNRRLCLGRPKRWARTKRDHRRGLGSKLGKLFLVPRQS